MELIKVYRYENQDGNGPYTVQNSVRPALHIKHAGDSHPSRREDFDYHYQQELYYCACSSRKALTKWFWGFNKKLKEAGFEVKSYSIPKENVEYGKSMKQLRFKK